MRVSEERPVLVRRDTLMMRFNSAAPQVFFFNSYSLSLSFWSMCYCGLNLPKLLGTHLLCLELSRLHSGACGEVDHPVRGGGLRFGEEELGALQDEVAAAPVAQPGRLFR